MPLACPLCGSQARQPVIDSRPRDSIKNAVYRRRECTACGRRFTTYERAEETHDDAASMDRAGVVMFEGGSERGGYDVPVVIGVLRRRYPRLEYFAIPKDGAGTFWVEADRVRLIDEPATRTKKRA